MSSSARIGLDPAAQQAVTQMIDALKEQEDHVRINPSRLVSWIVTRYAASHFEADRAEIIKRHFDSKEYLKTAIKGVSSVQEMEQVLKSALSRVAVSSSVGGRLARRRRAASARLLDSSEVAQDGPADSIRDAGDGADE